MSLPVLRKIVHLAKGGAVITGIKPTATPSLTDDPKEFEQLVKEVWESGNKKVTTGKPLSEVLSAMNIPPDFTYTSPPTQQNCCMCIADCPIAMCIG